MNSPIQPPLSEAIPMKKKQSPYIPTRQDNDLHSDVNEYASKDTWTVLIVFRCINAALVWTFFQPDEYFQALEPAWQMAFGPGSGAWITWEWQHQLRSSLHPAIFASVYFVVDKFLEFVACFPQFRAMIMSVLPNLVQGIFAALGDYYTWQLAEKIYGTGSNTAQTVLLITMLSPWQWFCSTRTFSNSLETTLTIVALYYWPWEISVDMETPSDLDNAKSADVQSTPAKTSAPLSIFRTSQSVKNLRISLLLSCTACILRPTNALIWFCVLMPAVLGAFSSKPKVPLADYLILTREAVFCGSAVLLVSALSDYLYFGEWTFPPYQWLHFNISQDLAVFYGRNDWHYYLSQGLPLLLTTYLPFTLVGLWHSGSAPVTSIQFLFTTIILVTIATLSLISHKEVRFIYPLLPLLHILTAPTVSTFFSTTTTTATPTTTTSTPLTETETTIRRKPLLALLLLLNLSISTYTTTYHQSGVLSALTFLRHEYETLALDGRGQLLSSPSAGMYDSTPKTTTYTDTETFAAFLMPCHSTPWRSQLIYPGLKAWALGCEPPVHLPAGSKEREGYRDEADRFYDEPGRFLREEVGTVGKPWPRFVVGFEGVEGVVREGFEGGKGGGVRERWRGFNSHWHDDHRRRGDVVIWELVNGSEA